MSGGKNVVITISACLLQSNKCFRPFKDAESPSHCMSFLHVRMLAKDFHNLGSYFAVMRINKSTSSEINNIIIYHSQ